MNYKDTEVPVAIFATGHRIDPIEGFEENLERLLSNHLHQPIRLLVPADLPESNVALDIADRRGWGCTLLPLEDEVYGVSAPLYQSVKALTYRPRFVIIFIMDRFPRHHIETIYRKYRKIYTNTNGQYCATKIIKV